MLGKLRVTLVAVNTDGFGNLVRRLLEEGLYLSQITILYDPMGEYANVHTFVSDGRTVVEWRGDAAHLPTWTSPAPSRNLGRLMLGLPT